MARGDFAENERHTKWDFDAGKRANPSIQATEKTNLP